MHTVIVTVYMYTCRYLLPSHCFRYFDLKYHFHKSVDYQNICKTECLMHHNCIECNNTNYYFWVMMQSFFLIYGVSESLDTFMTILVRPASNVFYFNEASMHYESKVYCMKVLYIDQTWPSVAQFIIKQDGDWCKSNFRRRAWWTPRSWWWPSCHHRPAPPCGQARHQRNVYSSPGKPKIAEK